MTAHEENWAEARLRTKVEPWCLELLWQCKARSWYLEIHPNAEDEVNVIWPSAAGQAPVVLIVPISRGGAQFSPWPPEVLLFVLRRNANLEHMHWCITRYDGLCVTAARELDTLTMDGFQGLVEALLAERKALMELAAKEPDAKQEAKP